MKISIIGTGYVGLVTGTCLSEMGNHVTCVDNNKEKIDKLLQGEIPIWEPGLEELVEKNTNENRLFFSTDIKNAIEKTDICFIAVGTPSDEDGSADLKYVLSVAQSIGKYLNGYKIIVDKSTVPVGTADKVRETIKDELKKRKVNYNFDVVSNPEFLKEGDAINDFMKPDRIVIGADDKKASKIMHELYSPFARSREKIIEMSVRSAEMTKYAANAMLATKISFMNDIANLCERLGADVKEVRHGIGSDSRIGYKFIYPGIGYGGSCFPKDVKAIIKMGEENGVELKILKSVEAVNENQKKILFNKLMNHFNNNIKGKTFAIWGLSFKPKTDDMREAPSIVIINLLLKHGAKIKAYDPVAMTEAKRIFGENKNIIYTNDHYSALKDSSALLLLTEWNQFRFPDFEKIKNTLKHPVIFDGRNQYEPNEMKKFGIVYYSIGRKPVKY